MTNNYPIGSQWKTRGGWRAVVVSEGETLQAFHAHGNHNWGELAIHESSGKYPSSACFDLLEPWQEPRKGTVWVGIFEDGHRYAARDESCMRAYSTGFGKPLIAKLEVPWVEGMGLEDKG